MSLRRCVGSKTIRFFLFSSSLPLLALPLLLLLLHLFGYFFFLFRPILPMSRGVVEHEYRILCGILMRACSFVCVCPRIYCVWVWAIVFQFLVVFCTNFFVRNGRHCITDLDDICELVCVCVSLWECFFGNASSNLVDFLSFFCTVNCNGSNVYDKGEAKQRPKWMESVSIEHIFQFEMEMIASYGFTLTQDDDKLLYVSAIKYFESDLPSCTALTHTHTSSKLSLISSPSTYSK